MLKTRVIPVLLVKDGLLKKPVRFRNPRTIAHPISIARVFEARQVDELILLDIGRTLDDEAVDPDLVLAMCEELSVPLAYGGGIRSIGDMLEIISAGAEKVVVNTQAVATPEIISAGADALGSQCIVVSIDALRRDGGCYEVMTRCATQATGLDAVDWARQAEQAGAGELLINSVLHEGAMEGYDVDLIRRVAAAVTVPVIAAGGAGKLEDFVEAVVRGRASAVAAGSIYHYRRTTPNMVKGALREAGIPVRLTGAVDE